MGICSFQEHGSLSISLEDLIIYLLILIIHFLSVLKISKTLVLSGEYSKKYGQGTVFTTDLKNNPWPYLVKCSLDVFKKKTKF